ncbi:hypothetical protein FGO68_gene17271 [Halteria grandinella]|uniref:Transmembrane protein n=1 Tax=Halteria grandinella TaxID=5974 RepID=A0A8J8NPT0_HALGN|nr:hypothetical protein FGO68_gene17271 [Halteria grandinella]
MIEIAQENEISYLEINTTNGYNCEQLLKMVAHQIIDSRQQLYNALIIERNQDIANRINMGEIFFLNFIREMLLLTITGLLKFTFILELILALVNLILVDYTNIMRTSIDFNQQIFDDIDADKYFEWFIIFSAVFYILQILYGAFYEKRRYFTYIPPQLLAYQLIYNVILYWSFYYIFIYDSQPLNMQIILAFGRMLLENILMSLFVQLPAAVIESEKKFEGMEQLNDPDVSE